jgi:16S rRNA processing protein RimM
MPRQNKTQEYSRLERPQEPGEPDFLAVGRLLRPHGLTGDMVMDIYTDFPERLQPGRKVYLGDDHQPVQIRSRRGSNSGLLIGFDHLNSPEEAGTLRNQIVYVKADEVPPLADGEYYHHQILGLKVLTDEGLELGVVSSILDTGSTDVYVVLTGDGKEILLPNIDPVVKEIDLKKGEMHVHLLEGLLPK